LNKYAALQALQRRLDAQLTVLSQGL